MGLAAKYQGDRNIRGDPAVVFTEDFEIQDVDALSGRWDHIGNPGGKALELTADVPPGSSGRRSLQMTATRGQNEGGSLFKVLLPGYDRLFARFYVKFAADHGFVHHFVKLEGAVNPPRYPTGGACLRPENAWITGIEPTPECRNTMPRTYFAPPGIWHFYTYWPEMRSWQNPDGTGTSFYGNDFEPNEPVQVPRDRWISVEFMVKMNSGPDAYDGEQAFWIDGKLTGRFLRGFKTGRWFKADFVQDPAGQPFEGYNPAATQSRQ